MFYFVLTIYSIVFLEKEYNIAERNNLWVKRRDEKLKKVAE